MTATVKEGDIIEQVTLKQCLEGMEALPRTQRRTEKCCLQRERSMC